MRLKYFFVITALAQLSVWGFMIGKDYDTNYLGFYLLEAATVINIVLLAILYNRIIKPLKILSDGLNMLKAQDWNTKLTKVGQRDVDEIIEVFNHMLEKLKSQRIRFEEQNHFLNILTDMAPVGVLIVGNDDRIKLINPACIDILSIDRCIPGSRLSDVKGTERLEEIPLGETRTFRTEKHSTLRCTHLDFIDCGATHRFYIIDNISDSIAAAEKETYGKVIRYISHEVNNTVAGLTSAFDILASYFDRQDADLSMLIETCSRRSKTLSDFIARYADVVKLSKPMLTPVRLDCFIATLCPFLSHLTTPDIELKFHSGCDGEEIMLDTDMFERVIINIVKNSAESIRSQASKGLIEIATRHDGNDKIELCVSDNGAGIDEATRSMLFTPFFTNKPGGHGVGLTFIAEVLRKHNFDFSLRTCPDGLTRFTISIPPIAPLHKKS